MFDLKFQIADYRFNAQGVKSLSFNLFEGDELLYILDPKDVYGPDFPSETFRDLKDKKESECGQYRTRRLVLQAWDAFENVIGDRQAQ